MGGEGRGGGLQVGMLLPAVKVGNFSFLGYRRAAHLSDHPQFLVLLCPPFCSDAKDFRVTL